MIRVNFLWMGTIAMAATLPLAAQAQGVNKGPYVGGGIGYNQPGDMTFDFRGTHTSPTQPTVPAELEQIPNTGIGAENEYKGSLIYSAVIGYGSASGLRPEFELGYRQNDVDETTYPDAGPGTKLGSDSVKITTTTGMFNLWYDLFPSWRIHPYVGGGVGMARYKINKQPTNRLSQGENSDADAGPPVCNAEDCDGPRKSDDAALAYQAGAGIRWDMFETVTVGLDYRYLKGGKGKFYGFEDQQDTHLDADYDEQSIKVSANYFFGGTPPPPPPVAPETVAVVAPLAICADGTDNDGDGQIDFPADPGCSAADDGDETDPPQCSDGQDNEGDGVIDFPSDKGCSAADDNDETDPCKTPEPGERISLKGCGTGDVIVLRGVNFEFDEARLTANAKTILDNVGEELTAYPEIEVELSGHTDAKGSDEYNQSLSDKRSRSVKSYLAGMGIANSRMTTVGLGESQPVADNETDEGRELNRRVELKVTAGVAPGGSEVKTESADPATDPTAVDPAAENASEAEAVTP